MGWDSVSQVYYYFFKTDFQQIAAPDTNADRRTCEFGRFIIGREYRALGYGRRALALAMSVARSLGVERISCEVLSTNDCALRLYDRCGFTVKAIDQTGLRRFISMEAELNKK